MVRNYSLWRKKGGLVRLIAYSLFLILAHASYTYSNNALDKQQIARGVSWSNRVVTGVARIVKTVADCQDVQMGDIVVAVMTCDQWLPALDRCAGIITDLRGESCHALLYGKKRGIPVIVGTGNATEKMSNGDYVELDCSASPYASVYVVHSEPSFVQPTMHGYSSSVVVCHSTNHEQHSAAQHACYHQLHNGQEEALVQSKKKKQLYITQDVFNRHYPSFIKYVLGMQKDINKGRVCESGMFFVAKWSLKCDPLTIECIPVSYMLFDESPNTIELELKNLDINFINNIYEKYKQKPGDKNWLARVSHEEHIKTITLPPEIQKEELMRKPSQYKQLIDQKRVDSKECFVRIAAGLFVRYWVDNNCQV